MNISFIVQEPPLSGGFLGLNTSPDALFVATALEEKAEAFIINDVRLQGIETIEIVLLNDFVE